MHDQRGFTLIELLVVVLIIGILAAIAIPAFVGQRNRAEDTDAKSAVRNAHMAMETFFTDNRHYQATAAELQEIEPALAQAPGASLVVTPGLNDYSLQVTSRTGNLWRISRLSASGVVTRSCTRVTPRGSCPLTGSW